MINIFDDKKGITLVEVLIVILILGALAGISVPTYSALSNRAKESATEAEMRNIANVLELYDTKNLGYPLTSQGIEVVEGPDISDVPESDKWDNPYIYTSDSIDYELRSRGVDGVQGNDDDIVFSNGNMTGLGAYDRRQSGEEPLTSLGNTYTEITTNIISLIEDFYQENGGYPRSWGDYAYTDIGLDPEEWQQAYDHIIYSPAGYKVNIKPEDDYAFIVTDLEGNQRTLSYSYNWVLVYSMEEENWYYHSIEEGNEIDIETLQVVED